MKRHLLSLCVLARVLGAAPAAFAQFDTATVVGTVRDDTGSIVPGMTVTLTNLDTGRYKVTAELEGFSTALADNVQLTVGGRRL